MKKYLVVLLALAMVFALATTAMAADTQIPDYTDVQPGTTPYASDIYRLTALGVTVGDGLGTNYRPADSLTREEFAKIACFMFGVNNEKAYYAAEKSAFSDVAEGKWSEGYINCANAYGLMVGVGGGKFAPTAKVSTQEVAAVVLRAVGYDKNLPGTWPQKYIAKANEAKAMWTTETLGDYVFPIGSNAATRAQVAGIVNYALDLYKVAYVGKDAADADKDGFAYRTADTNEASIYNYFLNPLEAIKAGYITLGSHNEITFPVDKLIGQKATVLWNIFHCIEVPYLFTPWDDDSYENLAEGQGWGFQDFEKGELYFSDLINCVPVATDYYIYDESLDGKLWQVSGRFADLTVKIDTKGFVLTNFKGVEALYADLQSDVEYVDAEQEIDLYGFADRKVDNANVYSLQDDFLNGIIGEIDCYAVYDYDDYRGYDFGIVKSNKDGKLSFEKEAGVLPTFGDIQYAGKKAVNSAFLSLEQNALVAPETIAAGDVIYDTENVPYAKGADLYIVISSKSGNLAPQLSKNYVTIDGAKQLVQAPPTPANSYLNDGTGFASYNVAYEAYAADMDGARDVAWAKSYAKKYFAYISDGIWSDATGVITKIEKEISFKDNPYIAHGPAIAWADAVAITIFDKNGEETTYAVDEDDVLGLLAEGDLVTLTLKNDGAFAAALVDTPETGFPYGVSYNGPGMPFDFTGIEVLNDKTGKIEIQHTGGYEPQGVLADDVVIFSLTADGDDFDGVELITRDEFLAKDLWNVQYAWAEYDNGTSSIITLYLINAEENIDGAYMDLFVSDEVECYVEGSSYFVEINGTVYEVEKPLYDAIEQFDDLGRNGVLLWEYDHTNSPSGSFFRGGLVDDDDTADDVDGSYDNNEFEFGGKIYGIYYDEITWANIDRTGRDYEVPDLFGGEDTLELSDDTIFFNVESGEVIDSTDIADEDGIVIISNPDDSIKYVLVIPDGYTPEPGNLDHGFFIW